MYHLFLLLISAIFLYTYQLASLPFAVHGDEGEMAMQALAISANNLSIFGLGWYDIPLVSFFPHLVTMNLFGMDAFGNRMAAVIFSVATLPFFYLLVKQLFSDQENKVSFFSSRIAFVATFLLATSHIWIALSRVGLSYTQAAFFVVTTCYFVVKGIEQRKLFPFVIGGIFLAGCFYSYYAARITPLLLLPYIGFSFFMSQYKKQLLFHLIVFGFIASLFLLPVLPTYLENPHAFSARTQEVYIFSDANKQWVQTTYPGKNIIDVIAAQLSNTLNIFQGDSSGQYGYKGQLFDYLTLLFLILGVGVCLSKWGIKSMFVLWWLVISLVVGQALTTNPPPIFLPRFATGLPVLYIVCALGFDLILRLLKKPRLQFPFGASTLIVILFVNLTIYFTVYPKQAALGIAGDPNALAATKIAQYINALPQTYTTTFFTAPYLYAEFGTLRFLSPDRKRRGASVTQQSMTDAENNILGLQDLQNKNQVFVFYPYTKGQYEQIKKMYPHGELTKLNSPIQTTDVYLYTTK